MRSATCRSARRIGQHDAGGALSGSTYSITGGYWSLINVVQTPGAPLLTVTPSGANVIVSWPSLATGFVLQQNPDIGNPNGWSNYGGTVNRNATTLSVTIALATGNRFFRLKQP
jgi:hypothetical protein